ncbi:hypothetical protein CBR_g19040 [Chara braunii]|uniref:Mitochondrial import inner membrane translocase subunit TIM22 n=1 Tax=Chara braunii TaxID=69332 RepID=A0A388KXF2_CHABU|nr:hypothetical protein CBR_g19040 [Chara braunii]|eukprot:GBG74633.1 hypothetical protein CBR_g19040 [Chara braunii]
MESSRGGDEGDGASASSPSAAPVQHYTRQDYQAIDFHNNCAVKTILSGVMGGGMGLLMGFLFGGYDPCFADEALSMRQKLWISTKSAGVRSLQMAKGFALVGAIYSGTECIVEKARAKHDMNNTVIAGCITGGSLSAKGGPRAACAGCVGFAAFSVLIDKVMQGD